MTKSEDAWYFCIHKNNVPGFRKKNNVPKKRHAQARLIETGASNANMNGKDDRYRASRAGGMRVCRGQS